MTSKTATITTWGSKSQDAGRDNSSFYSSRSMPARRDETQPQVISSGQHVTSMRNKLGFFDKLAVDRASKDEARQVIGELVVQLLEKQKQEIVFKIGLELADGKKRMFAESMREGALIEKEIAARSTEFERELIDLALDQGLAGHEQKKLRLERLEQWRSTGKIDDESYMTERGKVETWERIFRDNLDAKVEIILRNHAQQIERALVLFQERTIAGHPI